MNARTQRFAVSVMALAVRGALTAMAAMPLAALAQGEEGDVASLVNPTNFVEIGVINTSADSAKYGEYNGLNKKGADLLGNFGVNGGDAYGQGSGTTRWSVSGYDLGTTSRELGAAVSNQGTWNLGIKYDELRHNITDTYQTPFQGSMGGNTFRLPANFGVINTTAPGARSLTPAQLSDFQTQDVHSDRKNASFSAGYVFNRQWDVKFDFNRLDQSGAKLIASGTDALRLGGHTFAGEDPLILMNPTSYQTDTYNLALNWLGERSYATVSYYASLFHDDFNGLSYNNPFCSNTANCGGATGFQTALPISFMSTPPSNQLHQLNLTGGYSFTPTTKLAGGLSYGRNTQNDSYDGTYTPGKVPGLPVNSLDGRVITKHADLKLTNQTTKDLTLSAGLKYNERDNQTSSNVYRFLRLQDQLTAALVPEFNIPMSNKRFQAEIAGDYRLSNRQNLHLGYEYDQIKRWCDNSLPAGFPLTNPTGTTAAAYYAGGTSCVQVPESKENKLVLGYRLRASDAVSVNAGYSYAKRDADINSSFYNPMQSNSQGFENKGYIAFFDASRKEQMLKAGVNWQAAEKLNIGLNGRYAKDDYEDSTLGVQDGHTGSVNLDATYALSEKNTVSAYATWQERKRDLLTANGNFATAASPRLWTNHLNDRDVTVGIGAKQKGLMGNKLALSEDLTYSQAKTTYSTDSFSWTSGTTVCTAASNLNCGPLPDIKSDLLQLKVTGTYQINKPSQVVMGYIYQRLKATDYFYNPYQYGFTPTSLLPTNQQAPSYSVNGVFVAYNYNFR